MNNKRILIDVQMEPTIGSRFQPTGFPDLGHAEFDRPKRDGGTERCLLVESAQSMANHLEGTAWDDASNAPVGVVGGLPFVRVVRQGTGEFITSSRTEAHRLASAFIKESTIDGKPVIDFIGSQLGLVVDTPLDHRLIAREVFRLDPFALLHGVFFADKKWPGQPKIARVVSAFIEAIDVQRADSGGVKKDHVRHAIEEGSSGSSEGYGTVPFARTEWTARQIIASFSVDLKQIQSYSLGPEASDLLQSIALWEIRSLLEGGLRLRTACYLSLVDDEIRDRSGQVLPSFDELQTRVTDGVAAVSGLLNGASVLDVVWNGGKKAKTGKAATNEEAQD